MQRKCSCVRLIGYCTGVTLASALGLAILFATVSAAFAGQAQSPDTPNAAQSPARETQTVTPDSQQKFSGMVTDELCGARHNKYPGKTASECAKLCAVSGAKYVLLDKDNVYILAGKDLALDKLAGRRAIVTGKLQGNSIVVSSVAAEQP